MKHFLEMRDEPVFFILEIPTDLDDEKKIKEGLSGGFHTDVYYLDGCSHDEAVTCSTVSVPFLSPTA